MSTLPDSVSAPEAQRANCAVATGSISALHRELEYLAETWLNRYHQTLGDTANLLYCRDELLRLVDKSNAAYEPRH
jgi:hypothetical protein